MDLMFGTEADIRNGRIGTFTDRWISPKNNSFRYADSINNFHGFTDPANAVDYGL